ncbi:MAG: helix-turn-helix transcriptional regulator [Synergistes sp.]|nr:helix-turn-helix transcriptional regulator [Synergistes sp.]
MREKNIGKFELAKALGKRPNEVTRWLSGQHNFTLRTLSILSAFFGQPIISVD